MMLVSIFCDHCDDVRVGHQRENAQQLRRRLKERGWGRLRSGDNVKDLCPRCKGHIERAIPKAVPA